MCCLHGSVNIDLVNYQIAIEQIPIYGPIYAAHKTSILRIYRYIEALSNE